MAGQKRQFSAGLLAQVDANKRAKYAMAKSMSRKTYIKTTASPILRKLVKQIVHSTEEVKSQQYYSGSLTVTNPISTTWTGTFINVAPDAALAPVIAQGTGQGDRVGDKIRVKKATFSGSIFPFNQSGTVNAVPQPVYVVMWILYDKTNPTSIPDATGLIQFGDTSLSPSGTLRDLNSVSNLDRYRVFHKQIFKVGYQSNTGNGAAPAFGNYANNDFLLSSTFNIDITKFLPAVITYNDANNAPTSHGVYVIMEFVNYNNGSIGANDYIKANYQYCVDIKYTDM